jgi:hypothetical protein
MEQASTVAPFRPFSQPRPRPTMLTTILGSESATSAIAIASLTDRLCLAWRTPSNGVRVATGPGLTAGDYTPTIATIPGTANVMGIALASLQDRVVVAWFDLIGTVRVASSVDGVSWSAPSVVPSLKAGSGLTAATTGAGILIGVVDAAGQLKLATTTDLTAFSPALATGRNLGGTPTITEVVDPVLGTHIVIAAPTADARLWTSVFPASDLWDPSTWRDDEADISCKAVSAGSLARADGVSVALVTHDGVATVRSATVGPMAAIMLGAGRPMSRASDDPPSVAVLDGEAFVAFSDAGRPVVGSAVRLFPGVADGQRCLPGECPPDDAVVCVAEEEAVVWRPAYIANARKGDLILSPADGHGAIGTLLNEVQPSQVHDHMGIMLADRLLIRHCTESKDRLKEKGYYTGGIWFENAPSNGMRPDHLKYGWPGAITQRIEDAFYTGLRGAFDQQWSFEHIFDESAQAPLPADYYAVAPAHRDTDVGRMLEYWDPDATGLNVALKAGYASVMKATEALMDEPATPAQVADRRQRWMELGRHWPIANFPNGPAMRDGRLLYPLVVRPPLDVEHEVAWVRPLLRALADVCVDIRAHYRFYAYTRAAIGIDGSADPPPKGDAEWPAEFGADWAVGTRPLVCSTFIWAAVRELSAVLRTTIELEGPSEATANDGTTPHRKPAAADGLYLYSEDERVAAGTALHARLVDDVETSLYEGTSGVESLLATFGAWVADMADDVGTQVCNAFALDRADETDDHLWESPGIGEAVSPDDTLLHWDPPRAGTEVFHGLYGASERALLIPGAYEWARVHRLRNADGMAHVTGEVRRRDPATHVEDVVSAIVFVGCESVVCDADGRYHITTGAGVRSIEATYYDAAQDVHYAGRMDCTLEDGISSPPRLYLDGPPTWRRRVVMVGETRIYHNPDVGEVVANTSPLCDERIVAHDPALLAHAGADSREWQLVATATMAGGSKNFNGHHINYVVVISATDDAGTVNVEVRSMFYVDDDLKEEDEGTSFVLAPGAQQHYKYEASSYEFLDSNDNGRVEFDITNQWARV